MTDKHIIIIAEAGVNHNGDIDMARRMVAEARKAGADYVKFQTAVPELVISTFAPKAEYADKLHRNSPAQPRGLESATCQRDSLRAIHCESAHNLAARHFEPHTPATAILASVLLPSLDSARRRKA